MLPRNEFDLFLVMVEDAEDLAHEGDAADGYEVLLAGLHRARDVEGEPWGEELVRRYLEAVERFAARYRIGRG
jgi:hypothetical protein